MKLCSFIMPTRSASLGQLMIACRSILDGVPEENLGDLEILLRVDDDDQQRIPFAQTLVRNYGKAVIGPRGGGYINMGAFVSDLVSVADSKWCWLFDDDAWVEGDWYGRLSEMDGAKAVNAEFYVLGESYYRNGARGGAPGIIMPTEFCKKLEHRNPVDQQWLDEVHRNNWIVQQMAGVKYHHDGRAR